MQLKLPVKLCGLDKTLVRQLFHRFQFQVIGFNMNKQLVTSLFLVGLCQIVSGSSSDDDDMTTISGQIFCDNFCKVYFNGQAVFIDEEFPRAVHQFEFEAPKTGTRTFAFWLADSPYDSDNGIRFIQSGPVAEFFLDVNNDGILDFENYWCLGGGGFRGMYCTIKRK